MNEWLKNDKPLAGQMGDGAYDLAPTAPALELTSQDAPAERPYFDPFLAAARKKLNAPPSWEWFELRALDAGDVLVRGDVPKHPERSWSARWRGNKVRDSQQCVVTQAEKDAACALYEQETGNCYRCAGTGEVWTSTSVTDGTKYRTCERCNGTKVPPAAPGRADD